MKITFPRFVLFGVRQYKKKVFFFYAKLMSSHLLKKGKGKLRIRIKLIMFWDGNQYERYAMWNIKKAILGRQFKRRH